MTIAELLHEAANAPRVYRIVDGDDPDWASWYADWLITLSELPQLLGATPVRSDLVHTLVTLDRNTQPSRAMRAGRTGTRSGSPNGSASGRRRRTPAPG